MICKSPDIKQAAMPQRTVSLVTAQPQGVWSRPAVANFTFGSAGAGLYVVSVGFQIVAGKTISLPWLGTVRIAAAGAVLLGLAAVTLEAKRPSRGRYLLGNLRRSWMARETLAGIFFVPSAILTACVNSIGLVGFATAAAILFIVSQAFILYRAPAIVAWNTPSLPLVFMSSAFATGSGLLLVLPEPSNNTIGLATAAACSVADLLFWCIYIFAPAGHEWPSAATAPLRKPGSLFRTVAFGRLLPILLLLIALLPDEQLTPRWSVPIAGLVLLIGSWTQKDSIIRGCGYLRPLKFELQLSDKVNAISERVANV